MYLGINKDFSLWCKQANEVFSNSSLANDDRIEHLRKQKARPEGL